MTDIFDKATELEELEREAAIARQLGRRRPDGKGKECADCGDPISKKRREAVPGCIRCVECARLAEARNKLMNR